MMYEQMFNLQKCPLIFYIQVLFIYCRVPRYFLGRIECATALGTDVGNAYLESHTKEMVYVVAGSEFGASKGHTLSISNTLYGLSSSGESWNDRFHDVQKQQRCLPCKYEPDLCNAWYPIWITCHICWWLDDCIKAPESNINILTENYKFKLKGKEPLHYHLGVITIMMLMTIYAFLQRNILRYVSIMFSIWTKTMHKYRSPLELGDHNEIDTFDFLAWNCSLSIHYWWIEMMKFDLAVSVGTISTFRAAQRKGHMERVKRICGCLAMACSNSNIKFSNVLDPVVGTDEVCRMYRLSLLAVSV